MQLGTDLGGRSSIAHIGMTCKPVLFMPSRPSSCTVFVEIKHLEGGARKRDWRDHMKFRSANPNNKHRCN